MSYRGKQLSGSLLSGFVFALLTWLVMGGYRGSIGGNYEWVGYVVMVLLFPGIFIGLIVGGNIHTVNILIAVLGNFFFYFGSTYIGTRVWKKRRAKGKAVTSAKAE